MVHWCHFNIGTRTTTNLQTFKRGRSAGSRHKLEEPDDDSGSLEKELGPPTWTDHRRMSSKPGGTFKVSIQKDSWDS